MESEELVGFCRVGGVERFRGFRGAGRVSSLGSRVKV